MTSRRGFLGALLGAAVLDPDRLLWVPGAKLISVPAPRVFESGVAITAYWRELDRGAVFGYQRAYNAALSAQIETIKGTIGWSLL